MMIPFLFFGDDDLWIDALLGNSARILLLPDEEEDGLDGVMKKHAAPGRRCANDRSSNNSSSSDLRRSAPNDGDDKNTIIFVVPLPLLIIELLIVDGRMVDEYVRLLSKQSSWISIADFFPPFFPPN